MYKDKKEAKEKKHDTLKFSLFLFVLHANNCVNQKEQTVKVASNFKVQVMSGEHENYKLHYHIKCSSALLIRLLWKNWTVYSLLITTPTDQSWQGKEDHRAARVDSSPYPM